MGGDAHFRIDGDVIPVVRLARGIEIAGEDEAGFRLRLGGVDLDPPEDEVAAPRDPCGRDALRQLGDAVLEPGQDAGARRRIRSASANDVKPPKCRQNYNKDRPTDGECAARIRPNDFPRKTLPAPRLRPCSQGGNSAADSQEKTATW
jgi:hypothetical protein